MAEKRNILPGVLMIILSALGVLFGLASAGFSAAGLLWAGINGTPSGFDLPVLSSMLLSLTIGLLNIPALALFIRKAAGKAGANKAAPLFKPATIALAGWAAILAAGYFISRNASVQIWLAPLTIAAIILPVWWLIEFFRRGFPRSTRTREWGTLMIGLIASPTLIIIAEIVFILVLILGVAVALGTGVFGDLQLSSLIENANLIEGGIEQLEEVLYEIMQQPVIAAAAFVMIGLAAPLIEEVFKPMSTWFLLKRPLTLHEGYALGLISGGAFAILESAGIVIQMDAVDWLTAVALRAATGVLHIGLSGIVGYGFARSAQEKRARPAVLALLTAVVLHGGWNSLALLSGLSSFNLPSGIGTTSVIAFIFMGLVFVSIITINILIRRRIKQELDAENTGEEIGEANPDAARI